MSAKLAGLVRKDPDKVAGLARKDPDKVAGLARKDSDKVIRILHKGQVMSERFTGVSCQRLRRQPGQVAGFPGRKALGADLANSGKRI